MLLIHADAMSLQAYTIVCRAPNCWSSTKGRPILAGPDLQTMKFQVARGVFNSRFYDWVVCVSFLSTFLYWLLCLIHVTWSFMANLFDGYPIPQKCIIKELWTPCHFLSAYRLPWKVGCSWNVVVTHKMLNRKSDGISVCVCVCVCVCCLIRKWQLSLITWKGCVLVMFFFMYHDLHSWTQLVTIDEDTLIVDLTGILSTTTCGTAVGNGATKGKQPGGVTRSCFNLWPSRNNPTKVVIWYDIFNSYCWILHKYIDIYRASEPM